MKGKTALLTVAGIGFTLFCLLGVNWLGPLGAFLNLLTPVAAAYLVTRFGWQPGVVVVVVVSLLLVQVGPPSLLVAYLGLFGTASLLLPHLLGNGLAWDRAVAVSVLGSALIMAVLLSVTLAMGDRDYSTLVDQVLQAEVDQAMQVYQKSGVTEAQLQDLQQVVEGIAGFIRQTFVGLFLAGVLTVQLACLLVLQRLKVPGLRIEGALFRRWRLPAAIIWLLISAGFAMLVPQPFIQLLGQNMLAILLPLYFLQGLAVVSSYLQRKPYPPVVKGLIYLLVFILNPLPLVITGVGVFDLWVDFRRPRKKDI